MSLLDAGGVSTFDDLPIGEVAGGSQINLDYALLGSLIINSVFMVLFFIFFLISRLVAPKIYRKKSTKPKYYPLWRAFLHLFTIKDDDLQRDHGVDTYMFIYVFRNIFFITAVITLVNWIFIIPVNVLAGTMRFKYFTGVCNDTSTPGGNATNCTIWNVSGTNILTINNIDDSNEVEKAAYSCHTIITFLEAIFICFWYRRMYIHWVELRLKYKNLKKPMNYAVKVSGYDKDKFTEASLKKSIEEIFRVNLLSIHFVPNIPVLDKLRKDRYRLVLLYEKLEGIENRHLRKTGQPLNNPATGVISAPLRRIQDDIDNIDAKLKHLISHPEEWEYSILQRFDQMAPSAITASHTFKHSAIHFDSNIISEPLRRASSRSVSSLQKKYKRANKVVEDSLSSKLGIRSDNLNMTDTAYVTFDSIVDARIFVRTIFGNYIDWKAKPAKENDDIIWINHFPDTHSTERRIRRLIDLSFTTFCILFFLVPIVFICGLANLSSIAISIPSLKGFVEAIYSAPNLISNFISGLLPHFIIIILFEVLAFILRASTHSFWMPHTRSSGDRNFYIKFYIAKVLNILLGGLLASSFLGILRLIQTYFNQPVLLINAMGESIPKQSLFFMNYILMTGLSDSTWQLWSFTRMVQILIRLCTVYPTRRQRKKFYSPADNELMERYTDRVFVFTICMVYSQVSPLLLVFALFHFGMFYFTDMHNLVYTCRQKFEGYAIIWPTVFDSLCFALILQQLVLIGIFVLKNWIAGIVIAALTAIAVFLFAIRMHQQYLAIGMYGVVEGLRTAEYEITSEKQRVKFADYYIHKSLRKIKRKRMIYHDMQDRLADLSDSSSEELSTFSATTTAATTATMTNSPTVTSMDSTSVDSNVLHIVNTKDSVTSPQAASTNAPIATGETKTTDATSTTTTTPTKLTPDSSSDSATQQALTATIAMSTANLPRKKKKKSLSNEGVTGTTNATTHTATTATTEKTDTLPATNASPSTKKSSKHHHHHHHHHHAKDATTNEPNSKQASPTNVASTTNASAATTGATTAGVTDPQSKTTSIGVADPQQSTLTPVTHPLGSTLKHKRKKWADVDRDIDPNLLLLQSSSSTSHVNLQSTI